MAESVRVEILTYAPTEFRHCQHCELVWDQFKFNQRAHAEQRASALPPDLQAEYDAITDWAMEARRRYGSRLSFRLVDAASLEGFVKALRYRSRTFPTFVIDGGDPITGFDRDLLDAALTRRLDAGALTPAVDERRPAAEDTRLQ